MSDLRNLVNKLTIELHEVRRNVIEDYSDNISRDLAALRVKINADRAEALLGPSPVEPIYPGQEEV